MQKETIVTFNRKRFSSTAITALLLTLGATLAQAHPGHGLLDQGLAHALTNADHLFLLTAIGVGLFCIGRTVQRRVPRRMLQSLGGLILVIAGVLWKFSP